MRLLVDDVSDRKSLTDNWFGIMPNLWDFSEELGVEKKGGIMDEECSPMLVTSTSRSLSGPLLLPLVSVLLELSS